MICVTCKYEQTPKGCETPGCPESIYMTDEVRQRVAREKAEREDRERIWKIRQRVMDSYKNR